MKTKLVPTLRTTLLADSAVCLLSGALLVAWPLPLATHFATAELLVAGAPLGVFLRWLGAAVLLIGAGVYAVARQRRIAPRAVFPILVIEVLWLAGCAWLGATYYPHLTAAGVAFLLAAAVIVLLFLVLETLGLQHHAPTDNLA